ncbi:DUF4249 domain-containing protein [Pontibacter burrus]|uniref:DUF4249 domain-containing protein n=1 Tax=Pontibacter burrus TaxID=2704466 RepID=A0A6B3LJU6_9BACT|nr:DUF4249 domain-containing protein [Pontibacter burrus]NEM96999.1 DUF4249 domain-containing protein [Pontibacter burrus]
MKPINWKNILGFLIMLLATGCVEPYAPEVIQSPNSYLVVNGFINANGTTTIKLQRTQNLDDNTPPPPENGAIMMVESEDGEKFGMVQPESGVYVTAPLTLDPQKKYRLFIRTRTGKEYASEFVEVKETPEIDEVTWKPVDDELRIYVSSHDPNNNTWYYRWEFENTWQFRSAFFTAVKYENNDVVYREEGDPQIYICWKSEKSTTIEVATSKQLTSDVMSNYNVYTIPYNSEKISHRYSILVKQFAITREAYDYLQLLKKNSENIGTLFDPLPSQLTGNIKSLSDPNEPVIGYIGATTEQTKRIFIDIRELPREWKLFNASCDLDTLFLATRNIKEAFGSGKLVPVDPLYKGSPNPYAYTFAPIHCVDCRETGTNVKPDFWK